MYSLCSVNTCLMSKKILQSNVMKSDILSTIDYLSDVENLVSFERAMFECNSYKYRTKLLLLYMSISPL